jgi:hypothetical protein
MKLQGYITSGLRTILLGDWSRKGDRKSSYHAHEPPQIVYSCIHGARCPSVCALSLLLLPGSVICTSQHKRRYRRDIATEQCLVRTNILGWLDCWKTPWAVDLQYQDTTASATRSLPFNFQETTGGICCGA